MSVFSLPLAGAKVHSLGKSIHKLFEISRDEQGEDATDDELRYWELGSVYGCEVYLKKFLDAVLSKKGGRFAAEPSPRVAFLKHYIESRYAPILNVHNKTFFDCSDMQLWDTENKKMLKSARKTMDPDDEERWADEATEQAAKAVRVFNGAAFSPDFVGLYIAQWMESVTVNMISEVLDVLAFTRNCLCGPVCGDLPDPQQRPQGKNNLHYITDIREVDDALKEGRPGVKPEL